MMGRGAVTRFLAAMSPSVWRRYREAPRPRLRQCGELRLSDRLAPLDGDAGAGGVAERRFLDAGDDALVVIGDQPTADLEGRGGEDLAVLDQGELGRAAADIDVPS